jgi:hypothetical protein
VTREQQQISELSASDPVILGKDERRWKLKSQVVEPLFNFSHYYPSVWIDHAKKETPWYTTTEPGLGTGGYSFIADLA